MTQEEKDLLLKDICARLPYGVIALTEEGKGHICDINLTIFGTEIGVNTNPCIRGTFVIENIKPYLFPLSSLTEEQRNDISKLLIDTQNTFSPYGEINTKGCDNLFVCSVKQSNAFINYCLMHHLDINGLIEKGLAIDATGLNIY